MYRKDEIDDVMDLLLPETTETGTTTNDHLSSYRELSSCCEDGVDTACSPRSMLTKQLDRKIPGAMKLMLILLLFLPSVHSMPSHLDLK
jgi:hypothetical protein